ncbi:MAG: flavodoxin family protein [Spirochaetes bacterium]|nr:flavodoxin family protein [Spirochaetota bacterium]
MKATVITDKEFHTDLFQSLYIKVTEFLSSNNFETKKFDIGNDDLAFCTGCFGCWVKKPGECVMNDMMSDINLNFINSDTVIYLSPVIFGQFSANIKNALDRWLPNMLPFFIKRPDGSTMHPSRYKKYPYVLIIGYGNSISDEDSVLFRDVTKKHKKNAEVMLYRDSNTDITEELNKITAKKAGGHL